MRTARPLGLSPDGKLLIVATDDGEQIGIIADERLRAALRDDRPRMGQLEIDMESALRPREIQNRIRGGESLEDVARAAGVSPEQIEPFAGPVLAERDHIAMLAQSAPVRRSGEAVAHQTLRGVVSERLLSRGIDAEDAEWDAWRMAGTRWAVRLSYESGSAQREAEFVYDRTGRFSVAANDDARWLLGEQSSAHGPQPGRKRRADDSESTVDLNDELALVRAIQPEVDEGADAEDAYSEAELAEVDGVYDFVPAEKSNLDVLYDMLSTFDEDSVQIYSGLVRPAPDAPAGPVVEPTVEALPAKAAEATPDESPADQITEPVQPSLVDEHEEDAPEPTRPIKRKRASVPSWDEIVFGGPQPKKRR